MQEWLERLKLIEHFRMELEIEKSIFVQRLQKQVKEGTTNPLFGAFEAFSSGKEPFKGRVDFYGFKIRRRHRLFEVNTVKAIAEGRFSQMGSKLIVETTINGFPNYMWVVLLLLLSVYGSVISVLFLAENDANAPPLVFSLFMVGHGILIVGILYAAMRFGVRRMKRELEREFFYLTKA